MNNELKERLYKTADRNETAEALTVVPAVILLSIAFYTWLFGSACNSAWVPGFPIKCALLAGIWSIATYIIFSRAGWFSGELDNQLRMFTKYTINQENYYMIRLSSEQFESYTEEEPVHDDSCGIVGVQEAQKYSTDVATTTYFYRETLSTRPLSFDKKSWNGLLRLTKKRESEHKSTYLILNEEEYNELAHQYENKESRLRITGYQA